VVRSGTEMLNTKIRRKEGRKEEEHREEKRT
jgi:hypothetical protein